MNNNFLIIGYGSSAIRHIKNLHKINKDIFYFILSRKKKITLNFVKKNSFKHIKKLNEINLNEISNTFICTGSNEHFKHISNLSNTKTNIFVEKPLMDTSIKINEFKKILKKTKSKIYIGYNLLFSNSLNFLKKKKLEKEKINKINIKAAYYLPFWRKNINYKDSVSSSKKKGGGVLLELSHEIHYLLWLFGKPKWTSAIIQKKSNLKINVEDSANIILGFNKFICTVELDFISKKYIRFCQIDTNENTYVWNFKKNTVIKFSNKNKSKILFKQKFNLNNSYISQLNFFLNSSYVKVNSYIKYSIDTLKVIDAIRISSSKKGTIKKINYEN